MHRGLTPIVRAYDAVLYGRAWAAGFLMAAMMVVIFVDVVLRNLGYQSSAHFFTFTEYALLAVPCLGAPWLVREKGHIYVEIIFMYLGARQQVVVRYLIGALCILVCAVLAWYGSLVTARAFMQYAEYSRSSAMPPWICVRVIAL